ncbi:MAG: formyltetrahydrofolate deformylase, formyltetrahydrofolate deformylase [Candidatus Peregrinibacteria bacterium GW2011_GWC2_39_14]|nr:MAG: formyltetrahydrofolate deformylase, formyltetrahydrofolate deformylase [Candidatus Peregrinibacteria bacterium GW2011_GWC2_39_14]
MYKNKSARSILLISCPNKYGILHEIADFIDSKKGKIVGLRHIVEKTDNQLFMRVKWAGANELACDTDIEKEFQPIADRYDMEFKVSCSTRAKRLALFTSKTTHCLEKTLYNWKEGDLNVDIPVIIANSENIKELADFYKIPFYFISTQKPGYEKKQLEVLKKYNPDFIGLARYMKILSPEFVSEYKNKIINIHHSFLPCFIGANPYEDAYNRGVKLIGATSHFVIPELDQGPIIEQDVTHTKEGYDARKFEDQGKETEAKVFYEAIKKYTDDKLIIYKNKVIVF